MTRVLTVTITVLPTTPTPTSTPTSSSTTAAAAVPVLRLVRLPTPAGLTGSRPADVYSLLRVLWAAKSGGRVQWRRRLVLWFGALVERDRSMVFRHWQLLRSLASTAACCVRHDRRLSLQPCCKNVCSRLQAFWCQLALAASARALDVPSSGLAGGCADAGIPAVDMALLRLLA